MKMDFDDEVSGGFSLKGLVAGEADTMSDAIGAGAADGISDLMIPNYEHMKNTQ